jgi:cell division protein FtsL
METNSKLFKRSILIILIICTGLLLKQQYDIYQIKQDLAYIQTELDNTNNKLNTVEWNLSDEIENVRKAVILWSN